MCIDKLRHTYRVPHTVGVPRPGPESRRRLAFRFFGEGVEVASYKK
jgi:hypothetical protein